MRRHVNMGKKRKAVESKRSTLPADQLFAELGEPGQAPTKAMKPPAKPAAKPATK